MTWIRSLLLLSLLLILPGCASFHGPKHDAQPLKPAVVLLLPGSGVNASVASKIVQGAQIARDEISAQGTPVTLAVIDTKKPDWMKRLHEMPERFAVVGGPIEREVYDALKKSGLLKERVYFAFLNNLTGSDEGSVAYRFFPSPQDQTNSLVSFAVDGLKIRSFGAFYGNDTYSQKMTDIFEKTVRSKNASLQKASYSSVDKTTLRNQSKNLFNPTMSATGSVATPVPSTSFEAVFLPASWRHVDSILTAFLYHGEDRLVVLGSMSWEQNLRSRSIPNSARFELCAFPVAWNTLAKADVFTKANVKPDFWSALGHDFVHFVVNMRLPKKDVRAPITSYANRASSTLRFLAPISWDSRGIAHQKLFVYRITNSGIVPMDVASFEKLRTKRKEKASLRMQGGVSEPEVSSTYVKPKPISVEPAPQQQAPKQPVQMQMPPQTSYKLRLPTKPQQ